MSEIPKPVNDLWEVPNRWAPLLKNAGDDAAAMRRLVAYFETGPGRIESKVLRHALNVILARLDPADARSIWAIIEGIRLQARKQLLSEQWRQCLPPHPEHEE